METNDLLSEAAVKEAISDVVSKDRSKVKRYLEQLQHRIFELENAQQIQMVRDPLAAFVSIMELRLREHDDRPGWKDESHHYLVQRMEEQLLKLKAVVIYHQPGDAVKFAADVANFAMMIADNVSKKSGE